MRKMASIRSIDNIEPITGADSSEVATVGGWKVVVKKGEFKTNDLVVYLEIDSWVPTSLAPFLSKGRCSMVWKENVCKQLSYVVKSVRGFFFQLIAQLSVILSVMVKGMLFLFQKGMM